MAGKKHKLPEEHYPHVAALDCTVELRRYPARHCGCCGGEIYVNFPAVEIGGTPFHPDCAEEMLEAFTSMSMAEKMERARRFIA